MPKEKNLEFKVGLFVLLALIFLAVFIFSVADFNTFQEGRSLKVVFNFANGLKKNAPVRIAGVDQGLVKDLQLFFDRKDSRTKVLVDVWLKQDVQIPNDSEVWVNQLGLMGEKYVEIFPGVETKEFWENGRTVIGKDPIAQEMISERVLEVTNKLEQTVGGLNKIVSDENNILSIAQTLDNLSYLTGNLNQIAVDMKEGQGTVGHLLYDARLYNDLQELTSDLKENPWKLLYRPKKSRK